jgi:hypothetical protein
MIRRTLKLFAAASFCCFILLLKVLFISSPENSIVVVVHNNCSCSTCRPYNDLPVSTTILRQETTTSSALPKIDETVIVASNSVSERSDFNLNTSLVRTVQNCITKEVIGSWQPSIRQLNSVKHVRSKYRETSEDRLASFVRVYADHAWGFGWDDENGNKNLGFIGGSGKLHLFAIGLELHF